MTFSPNSRWMSSKHKQTPVPPVHQKTTNMPRGKSGALAAGGIAEKPWPLVALESNWLGCSASCPLRPAVQLRIRRPPPQSSTPAVKAVCRHHHQGVPCPPRASEASKPIRRRFPLLTTHGPLLRLQVKSRDFSQNIWNARIQPFLLKTASNGAFLPPPALRVRQRWMQLLLVGSEPAQECRAKP